MIEGINMNNAELFADANRGIYIPQHVAESIERRYVSDVPMEYWHVLEAGPNHPDYWETWDRVLDNAVIHHPEKGDCTFLQDGDLWIIPLTDIQDY